MCKLILYQRQLRRSILFFILNKEYKKDLGELFAKFDLDGSGKILKAELLDLLNKYGINISEQELTNYVKKANSKSGKFITVD